MADDALLIPETAEIESTFKAFSMDKGTSAGSTLRVVFTVPQGLTGIDLKRRILEEKEQLDLMVLTMERLRGSLNVDEFKTHRDFIKKSYDTVLKRNLTETGSSDSGT